MVTTQLSFGGVRAVSFCSKCKRLLSNPISVQAGMGPICRGHRRYDEVQEKDKMNRSDLSDENDFSRPLSEALIMRRAPVPAAPVQAEGHDRSQVGGVITNVPHLVVQHSPTGFEFGYAGSGPADLALNVCQWYLNHIGYRGRTDKCFDGECFTLAFALHQEFKRDFIALAPHEGCEFSFAQIDGWFTAHITKDMKQTHALFESEEVGE